MKIVWKKYPTARQLVAAMFEISARDIHPNDEALAAIKKRGMWAWVATKKRPVEVHYWHDGKRTKTELVFLLAHELGHVVGKKLKGNKEETRANEYAGVAARVVQKLFPGVGGLPPEDGLVG